MDMKPMQRNTDVSALVSRHRAAIMGAAALLIYFFHAWTPIFGAVPVLGTVEEFIKRTGFCGVDIFLFLSGMGLTYAFGKTGLVTFYLRRLKKLALPFLIVAIAEALCLKWSFPDFLKNVSGYHFYTQNIYAFLWFGPAIGTLYLLFPAYYSAFRRSARPLCFTLGAMAVWLLLSLTFARRMRLDLYGFTNRIPIFLFGIYFGARAQKGPFCLNPWGWLAVACVFVLGIFLSYKTNYDYIFLLVPVSNCCVPNFLIAASGVFLLSGGLEVLAGHSFTRVIGTALSGFLSFFGTFTWEFYCVQEFWGDLLRGWLPALGPRKMNLLMFLSTTAVAYLLHWIVTLLFQALGNLRKPADA